MNCKLIHFYPDLMSLYGSYANLSILRHTLEQMGNTVTLERIVPGQVADLGDADFIFLGAGAERVQHFVATDLLRFRSALHDAAECGMTMLFAGTAMELLGQEITTSEGTTYEGVGLAEFSTVQGSKRIVGDVYGSTDLFSDPVVGFMNKCSHISGVETPLLRSCEMGFGNEAQGGPEGFHFRNVFGSELTGPLLVKNPRLLESVVQAIYAHRGEPLPDKIPISSYAEEGYRVTVEQLRRRLDEANK